MIGEYNFILLYRVVFFAYPLVSGRYFEIIVTFPNRVPAFPLFTTSLHYEFQSQGEDQVFLPK